MKPPQFLRGHILGAACIVLGLSATAIHAANVQTTWGYPAAIVSINPGTKSSSLIKDANSGNVVVNGDKLGPIVVHGGDGLAILANGYVNIDKIYASAAPVSGTNYNTANEIPDYTSQGTANTLFDFNRYIAIADLTTNNYNPKGNNHFTNLATFFNANKWAYTNANPAARFLEGVIVVDIAGKDSNLSNMDPAHLPNGINVKGTLFFKFDSSFGPSDKIINAATMNINPANMTGFVATNAATYTSGYPPVYYNNSKNPTNINITSKGFANVTPGEDLPALLYSIGILDVHGNANISGVMYTPSFVEIENKVDNQIQYFKGSIICGLGLYFENVKKSSSVISFDPNTVDSIHTALDTTAPVLHVPADVTLEFPADTTTNATGVATATDASGSVNITFCDAVTNVCGTIQCIKRTWTAVDAFGNSASDLQTITVVDSLAPVLVSIDESPEGSGNFTLGWELMIGRTYHFQWRENLLAGEWQNLLVEGQEDYTADAAIVTVQHAVGAGAPHGFFRALVVTP